MAASGRDQRRLEGTLGGQPDATAFQRQPSFSEPAHRQRIDEVFLLQARAASVASSSPSSTGTAACTTGP